MRHYQVQCTYSSSSSIIRYEYSLYVLQSRAPRSRCSIPGTWYGICKQPTDCLNQSVYLARNKPLSAETTSLHVRATSRATPSPCDGEGEAQFAHGTWTYCEAPAWNPQCMQWFRADEFLLLPLPYTESHSTLQSR